MVRMAEREERERRRAEARRYPIDDTELLQELRDKAYAEGGTRLCSVSLLTHRLLMMQVHGTF